MGPSYWIFEMFGNACGIKSNLSRTVAAVQMLALGIRQAVTLGEEGVIVQNDVALDPCGYGPVESGMRPG